MMATTLEQTTLTIPGDYLEDFRSAVIADVKSDGEAIANVDRSSPTAGDDRNSSVKLLRQSMYVLDQLLDADGDTEVAGELTALVHVLEEMSCLLTARLAEQAEYGPLDLTAVRELATRVVWATTTAEAMA